MRRGSWGSEGASHFGYQPALDGVRALAVAFVLAFHLGLPWATGGYLGVSVFFTLSGFLITTLLLREHARRGSIETKEFYVRRLRRLLPASLLCIGTVSVLLVTGVFVEQAGTRSDVLSALFDVANWHALFAHRSYADLFSAPSPLAHFWSLAVEEQFYLVWPFALAGLAAWSVRRRDPQRSLVLVIVGLFVVLAASAPLTGWLWSRDAVYYASWARFAEIVAGAALAAILVNRRVPRSAHLFAPLCLGAIVVLCLVTPAGHGWAYAGGLPLFSLLSVGLIVGLQARGPLTSILSLKPLVRVGVLSYGLYLFHWPVFLVLDQRRTGWDGPGLIAARLIITYALAHAAFELIEHPVRARVVFKRSRPYLATAASAAFVVAVLGVTAVHDVPLHVRGTGPVVLAAASGRGHGARPATTRPTVHPSTTATAVPPSSSSDVSPSSSAAPAPPTSPSSTGFDGFVAPPEPYANPAPALVTKTVAVFGDSVPDWLVRDAAASYDRSDFVVVNAAHEACDGAVNAPPARSRQGDPLIPPADCQEWPVSYPPVVENPAQPIDIALLVLGQAPTVDRLVNGTWVSPCQDMSWYTTDVAARITYLKARVPQVVLALPSWGGKLITWFLPDDHVQRYGCIRDQLSQLAARTHIPTVDLAIVLCPDGPGRCNDYRDNDGLHVDPEDAITVLDWILDRLTVL